MSEDLLHDPYITLLRIAEIVHNQTTELKSVKQELEQMSVKFNAFKGILERIDDMTDALIDHPVSVQTDAPENENGDGNDAW